MKSILPQPLSLWLVLILGFAGLANLSAQEENLEMALKAQDRRIEGLTSLASRVKTLMTQFLPEGWIESEEEEPSVPDSSPKVEVREVKLVMNDAAASDSKPSEAVLTAAQQAELDAQAYLQSLQTAATKLNITGSFPKRKEIMIGAQNLGIGEEIAIEFHNHLYNLEILDVTSSELKLKDQESQMELTVAIGMTLSLPPGMSRSAPPEGFFQSAEQAKAAPLKATPGTLPSSDR